MVYHHSQQGNYNVHSQFAEGQVVFDYEGNAVYQLRPDGSPQFVPAGDQSPYRGAQTPGDYSPDWDLGKLEDYGPLTLNAVTFNELADLEALDALMKEAEDEELEETIPYCEGAQVVQVAIPSQSGGNTIHQAPTAHPSTHACSPFTSLTHQRKINVDFRPSEVHMGRPLSAHQSIVSPLAPAVQPGMQRGASPGQAGDSFPKPRSYKLKSVEQRAKEERKRAANYLAVRKNRLTAAERQPALLQRLYFLEKIMEHFGINICPTQVGLPKGYGYLKFVPTTCEEKKLNIPSSKL